MFSFTYSVSNISFIQLPLDLATDAEGKEVPPHAEL